MEIRDIVAVVSLLSTLITLAFIVGQLRGTYATKAELSAQEKDLRSLITAKERESLSSHNDFATKSEVEKVENELRGELKEARREITEFRRENAEQNKYMLGRVDTMNNTMASVLRALTLKHGKDTENNG